MSNYIDVQSNYTSGITCDIWVRPAETPCNITTDPTLSKKVVSNQPLTGGHRTFVATGDWSSISFWCPNISGYLTGVYVKVILRMTHAVLGEIELTSNEYFPVLFTNNHCPPNCVVPASEYIMNSAQNNPWDASGTYLPITSPGTVIMDFPPPPPVANFTTDVTTAVKGTMVKFYDACTGGTPIAWEWGYKKSTDPVSGWTWFSSCPDVPHGLCLQNPTQVFAEAAVYDIWFRARNTGGSGEVYKYNYLTITEPPSCPATCPSGSFCRGASTNYHCEYPPSVNFTASPTHGTVPLTVQFTNLTTGFEPITYRWRFNQWDTGTTKDPVYTYTSEGVHNVELIATNVVGETTKRSYITAEPPPSCPATCPDGQHCDGASTGYECVADGGTYNWVGIVVGAGLLGYLLLS